ncbi:MAG: DUF2953 domain-containing protein [Lachnospiraceae bacterium]|nr:DUF2953 domain-containing protein [Lachnospiraceae bacterium]
MKRMILILKSVRPRKITGFCEFGFEDPSHTGELLALASVFYSLYGDTLTLSPNFKEKCLKADADAAGRIYMGVLAWHALMAAACGDVRYAYRRYRELSSMEYNNKEVS